METQEYLQDAMGNLSQSSYVKGFDPSQNSMAKNQLNALLHRLHLSLGLETTYSQRYRLT
ncbi:hypothetical protein Bca52824_096405 [Brassica carinata]|uniref:Uncharacterized protein n=1 Tax=Brassica carinata TaxID=52824 RepID=A0A8X7P0P6_BRACI|nr:hypothetical protein Bca52824_096405 [Brassica carinata]